MSTYLVPFLNQLYASLLEYVTHLLGFFQWSRIFARDLDYQNKTELHSLCQTKNLIQKVYHFSQKLDMQLLSNDETLTYQ